MILQRLAAYYDALCTRPDSDVCPPGWSNAAVSGALCLDKDGTLSGFLPLEQPETTTRKAAAFQILKVPQQEKKTVGIAANFLCDTSGYFLGIDGKGKPDRAKKCFEASRERHTELLKDVNSSAARAVLNFYQNWDPAAAAENAVLQPWLEQILTGRSLVFRVEGSYAHEDPAICAAWQAKNAQSGGEERVCLVTGRREPIARLHASIKGVLGAQSSGASLVSFNADAFCSYEKEQGENAPVGERAAFAYTTALNYLLADRQHVMRIGDTAVVCWAEDAAPVYQDAFGGLMNGSENASVTAADAPRILDTLAAGVCCDVGAETLDPDMPFYVLGLAPNAARLSVRFFWQGNFGALMRHIKAHQDRLKIVRPAFDENEQLAIGQLLGETVNRKAKDKSAAPLLGGGVMRAILDDTPYPEELRQAVMLRIRAEREITRGRAAILKAFLLKKTSISANCKEVLTVELNEQSNYMPYLLGRSFAVLEWIQTAANPNLNSTIKDRYFNSACATPAVVFPILMRLHNSHLKVLKRERPGAAVNLEKLLGTLCGRMQETYPPHLTLDEQGAFILGYYHQVQKFYEKKEDGKNV